MFIGHYALGFAAKRAAPRMSLGTLFVAPTLADLLWPVFLLLSWEHAHVVPGPNPFFTLWLDDYPISHSLLTLIIWGGLFGYLYQRRTGNKRAGIVIALLVVSHWVLDFVTHRPDIQLYPGGAKLGLGLWNSPAATVIVESVMLIAGVAIYAGVTRARDGIGRWGLWGLVVLARGLVLQHAVHACADRHARDGHFRHHLRVAIRADCVVGGSPPRRYVRSSSTSMTFSISSTVL